MTDASAKAKHIPSLQVKAYQSAFELLSDDDKYEVIETLLNDLGILAWYDITHSGPLLKSLVRMESARMISKTVFDRMNQIIEVLSKQSLGSSYDAGAEKGKLFIYSPTIPRNEMNNNAGLIHIQDDIIHCLQSHTPSNIRIVGYKDANREHIYMSHLVHHYSKNVEMLTEFGYDLSEVLPGDD